MKTVGRYGVGAACGVLLTFSCPPAAQAGQEGAGTAEESWQKESGTAEESWQEESGAAKENWREESGAAKENWQELPGTAAMDEETENGAGSLEDGLEEYDLAGVEEFLREKLSGEEADFSFSSLLKMLAGGRMTEAVQMLVRAAGRSLTAGLEESAGLLGQVAVLGIAGAVFAGVSGIFQTGQISETGFFVTYLLIFTFLAAGFSQGAELAAEALRDILEFMRALMPAYFLAAAFSGGAVTAAGLYEGMLLLISGVQWLFLTVLLPGIQIYFLLMLAGHMAEEDMLSRLRELVKTGISWGIRTMAGLVLGMNLLQGMVLPYADAVKNSSLTKAVEAIPGIGGGIGAAAKMVMGSGVLIKNTMGAGAVFILALLSLAPIVKLGLLTVLYQLAAAVLEPVCDKRITSCVSEAAEGYRMLLKLTASALTLFAVAVAVVCAATNVSYYAG